MHFIQVALLGLTSVVSATSITPLTQTVSPPSSTESLLVGASPSTAVASIQTAAPESNPLIEDELRKRQNAGQVNNGAASVATQQSPVTQYMAYNAAGVQVPVVYTQLFSAVNEQWDAPKSGSIGLGTISGKIGVVKTNTKRNVAAEATAMVKRSFDKRAKKGSGSSNANSAGILSVPTTGTIILAGMGIVVGML